MTTTPDIMPEPVEPRQLPVHASTVNEEKEFMLLKHVHHSFSIKSTSSGRDNLLHVLDLQERHFSYLHDLIIYF